MNNEYSIYRNISDNIYTKEEKEKYWSVAIGLQAVDGLATSSYLHELSREEIEGHISLEEIEKNIYRKYEAETESDRKKRMKEADLVANRINAILRNEAFDFTPVQMKAIHKELFRDIYESAGEYRSYNFKKSEPVLFGNSVIYGDYKNISETLSYYFMEERFKKYEGMTAEEKILSITHFSSSIWQVHGFCEGNTRTVAVFIEKYLNTKGYSLNNDMFAHHAKYFRNALVRSCYDNERMGVYHTDEYLIKFFENLLLEKKHSLKNIELVLNVNRICERYPYEMKVEEIKQGKNLALWINDSDPRIKTLMKKTGYSKQKNGNMYP